MTGYITILLAALALILGAGGAYKFKSDADKVVLEKALAAQQSADTISCNASKKITEDTDVQVQTANTALQQRLNKLLHKPAKCVSVISHAASVNTAGGQQGQVAGNAGYSSDWFIEYAGDFEQDRIQMNACAKFVKAAQAQKVVH